MASEDGNNRLEGFPRFDDLAGEIRIMIWRMAMEEPRLVHLRAAGCGIGRFRRHGIPEHGGRYYHLRICGEKFEQIPVYFFVNHECRYYALEFYTIRFSVVERFRPPPSQAIPIVSKRTNLIMSPNDILVSWQTEELWVGRAYFSYFSNTKPSFG